MMVRKLRLGDISLSIQPGPFGSQLHRSDYSATGIPIIMPKDMVNGKISHNNLQYVSEGHVKRLARHQVHEGNILVARKGDVRKCVFITENEDGWLTGSDCLKISLNHNICFPKFVFYQLRSPIVARWMEQLSIGSTMPSLNSNLLGRIEIVIPNLDKQVKIAYILSKYDELIDNNQKQILLLEESAQRLYKEWFVKLHFPGYENTDVVDGVPWNWDKKKVGELLKKVNRRVEIKAVDYLPTGEIPVVDQSRNFIAGYTNNQEALISDVPIIIFGDHTRIIKYIQFPFARGADGTQVIISKNPRMPQSLFYCGLKNIDLSNYHYARHFKYLKEQYILLPEANISMLFDNIVSNNFRRIQLLRDINTRLSEARDRLLPKLMSGEINIDSITQ